MTYEELIERAKQSPSVIRASGVDLYGECARKYWFMNQARISPPVPRVGVALSTGTLFHTIMEETFRQSFDLEKGLAKAAAAVKEECSRLSKLWNTLPYPDDQDRCTKAVSDLERCLHVSSAIATIWWETCPPKFKPEDIIFIEEELSGEIAGHLVGGRIDYAVSNATGYCVLDYKTTSHPPEDVLAGRVFSLAFFIYCTLLERIRGSRPQGMIYNIIQRPTIKFCKKDKTFDDYVERVKLWYKDLATDAMASFFIPFTGGIPGLTTQEFNRLVTPLSHVLQNPDPIYWPRNAKSCTGLYGTPCPYYPLCSINPQFWEHELNRYTAPPLEENPEKELTSDDE